MGAFREQKQPSSANPTIINLWKDGLPLSEFCGWTLNGFLVYADHHVLETCSNAKTKSTIPCWSILLSWSKKKQVPFARDEKLYSSLHHSPYLTMNILQSYHSLPRQSNVTIQTPPFIDIISPAINLHLVPEFGYPRLHDSQIFGCRRWPSQWHRNIRSLELIRICYCFLSKSQIIISLFILSIHPMYTQGIPVSIPSIDVIYLSLTSPNRWPSHEPLSTTVNHCWPSLMTIAQIYQSINSHF